MKAKMGRKTRHHAKLVRKNIRGKKPAQRVARVAKRVITQAVPMEGDIVETRFEAPMEFMAVDLEPVVEVFEVYEAPEGMEDKG